MVFPHKDNGSPSHSGTVSNTCITKCHHRSSKHIEPDQITCGASNDDQAPITAGLFRLEAGNPITYTYTYEEMKLIIDGELQITDESGETVTGRTGDLFYFPKGSVITFATDTFGVGYFCGQRGADEA